VSKFDIPLDFLIDMEVAQGESRSRKKKRQWSTSSVENYGEIAEKLGSDDQNTDFLKLYRKDKSQDEGSSAAIQAVLRAQIQYLGVLRRAFRMKMMVGTDAREFSSIDHDRYAYNDGAITIAKIRGLKASPAVNPDDSAISDST
jgi:hypothetical protein